MVRGSSELRKIRKIAENSNGDVYGMTFRRDIWERFPDTYFSMSVSGDCIILASGCRNG